MSDLLASDFFRYLMNPIIYEMANKITGLLVVYLLSEDLIMLHDCSPNRFLTIMLEILVHWLFQGVQWLLSTNFQQ